MGRLRQPSTYAKAVARAACGVILTGSLVTAWPQLSQAEERGSQLTLQVMSDIHLTGDRAERKFAQALDDLQQAAGEAQALVVNGDLGNGKPRDYDALRSLLQTHAHPANVFFAIGNHEFYKAWTNRNGDWSKETFPNGESDAASVSRFLALTGEQKVYYDRWINGVHLIFLGSEKYRQSDPAIGDDAFLSAEQLSWLEKKLAERGGAYATHEKLPPAKPVLVFLHQPLPGTVAGSSVGSYRGVVQHNELKGILQKYPNAVLFSGHTHWELSLPNMVVRDRFAMVNSASVFEPWSASDMPIPLTLGQSEALVVNVYPDKLVVRGRNLRDHTWITGATHTIAIDGAK